MYPHMMGQVQQCIPIIPALVTQSHGSPGLAGQVVGQICQLQIRRRTTSIFSITVSVMKHDNQGKLEKQVFILLTDPCKSLFSKSERDGNQAKQERGTKS